MRKRISIITTFMCLVLCCAFITFGVYAASRATTSFSSTVVFSPTNAKVRIKGLIADHKAGTGSATNYYACNYNNQSKEDVVFDSWQFGNISFKEATENAGSTIVTPIKFYIQITNNVGVQLKYTFKATFDSSLVVKSGYKSSLNSGISNSNYFDITTETAPTTAPSGSVATSALTSGSAVTYNCAGLSTGMIVVEISVNQNNMNQGIAGANFGFQVNVERVQS